ncbi:non-canonical purine NTP pyrophosphatase [Capsulimonas corticalis]|uniref:dITP/XTP pyrophosphatase n=1 Tax=Capsulimonas corticalis TaxID=2219043 RepID=A0A402CQK5_9BACT|nr:RdgB/HAM1 family non-canonical purine NTP pyrophosphatase [Capsulimonas corticalis]BDI32661.1 non-canonical purine NTP pyrophosphatase [Capsulimonas corticalis]
MPTLVIATNNGGKRDDMRLLLAEVPELRDFDLLTMREAGYSDWDPEETGTNFIENALIKARSAASVTGLPALADDSGLCVDALDGGPGLKSARWLGAGVSDADKNSAILERLAGLTRESRGAYFICALAFALPSGATEVREGFCHGHIASQPLGDNGFGYDPIFIPNGGGLTLAQMNLAKKNEISHRRAAWRDLAPIMLTHI